MTSEPLLRGLTQAFPTYSKLGGWCIFQPQALYLFNIAVLETMMPRYDREY